MKILEFFRSRIILFVVQIFLLTLLISTIRYTVQITFNSGISNEQRWIVQILANYVLFNNLSGLYFIYIAWILISLIPIFLYNDLKKAYSMNLITFFFPNFFLYVFLSRYSKEYFNSHFTYHILHTILLGIIIIALSIGISLFLKKVRKVKPETRDSELQIISDQIKSKCPNCGAEFNSTPIYCYKCNRKLLVNI